MDKTLEQIAKKCLGIETFESRKSDSLDFYEVSVWDIKRALEDAYAQGKKSHKL